MSCSVQTACQAKVAQGCFVPLAEDENACQRVGKLSDAARLDMQGGCPNSPSSLTAPCSQE